jgi:hypothetical protein
MFEEEIKIIFHGNVTIFAWAEEASDPKAT